MAALARAKRLSAIHINFNGQPPELCGPHVALDIARQCSSTISQVGIETRVWKVIFPSLLLASPSIRIGLGRETCTCRGGCCADGPFSHQGYEP